MTRRVIIAGAMLLFAAGALVAGYYFWRLGQPATAAVERSTTDLFIDIEMDGIVSLSLDLVQAAGLRLDSWEPASFTLTSFGQPVPVLIRGNRLYFYGQGSESIYSRARPYRLSLEPPAGSQPLIQPEPVTPATPTGPTPVRRSIHLEENQVYASAAYHADFPDTWFWHTLHVQQTFETTFDLPAVADGSGEIRLHLYGQSHDPNIDPDHDFELRLNGRSLGTISWEGQTHFLAEAAIPAGTLQNGSNVLEFDNRGEGGAFVDIIQIDWVEIDFQAPAEAGESPVGFIPAAGPFFMGGFSTEPMIFDVTQPDRPLLLTDFAYQDGRVAFTAGSGQTLIAAAPENFPAPAALRPARTTMLTDRANRADLIIITTDGLAPALTPLVKAREEQGLAVTVALAGEIYDHFGEGESSPESLRRFVDYAVTHWTPPAPRYLLLVGAGRYDYRDYLGLLPENHVPSMMVPVTHSGETVSDSRLADLNDDGRPELAVGRWPLDDPEAVSRLVERTLAYENGQASDRVLFSADGSSTEFTSLSDRLVEASGVPAGNIEKLYGVPLESMTRSWNDGSWLISYVGHGSINLWGKDSLFNQEGIDGLRLNGSYAPPIVAQFTCLTGFYAHPKERSLSENLLTSDSGPVLIIGATSLTLSSSQRPFAEKILLNLQDPRFTRIGDAFLDAKTTLDLTDLGVQEVVDTFGLLGDPTALIIRPAP